MLKPLRVIDLDFNLLGEIPKYESLTLPTQMYRAEPLELKINRYMPGADFLQQGRIIFFEGDTSRAFQIRHKEIEMTTNGKASENWLVKAIPLHSWLSQRLCMPDKDKSQHVIEGKTPQETIVEMVRHNIIDPLNPNCKIPNLVFGTIQGTGELIDTDLRYSNLLEKVQEKCEAYNIGIRIRIDMEAKQFVFDVYTGDDRTAAQRDVPPVIFSPDFGTLAELEFKDSMLDYKSTAIVAGQGEGVERHILTVNDELSGLDRFELFVDARDVEDTRQETKRTTDEDGYVTESVLETPRPKEDIERDLRKRGEEKLASHAQVFYIGGQVYDSHFKFNRDWFVGDKVTVQHREWGIQLDVQVTSVVERHVAGQPYTLDITFDKDVPTFIDKIKRTLNNVDDRR